MYTKAFILKCPLFAKHTDKMYYQGVENKHASVYLIIT